MNDFLDIYIINRFCSVLEFARLVLVLFVREGSFSFGRPLSVIINQWSQCMTVVHVMDAHLNPPSPPKKKSENFKSIVFSI